MRLNPSIPSRGEIEENENTLTGRLDLPPFAPSGSADSFFDVFLEVELLDGTVLHTDRPKRMSSRILHKPPAPGDFMKTLRELICYFPMGSRQDFPWCYATCAQTCY